MSMNEPLNFGLGDAISKPLADLIPEPTEDDLTPSGTIIEIGEIGFLPVYKYFGGKLFGQQVGHTFTIPVPVFAFMVKEGDGNWSLELTVDPDFEHAFEEDEDDSWRESLQFLDEEADA